MPSMPQLLYVNGKTPEAKTTTYNNGKIDVPAKPSAVIAVDKANVKQAIIDSGYWPASDFTGPTVAGSSSSVQNRMFPITIPAFYHFSIPLSILVRRRCNGHSYLRDEKTSPRPSLV